MHIEELELDEFRSFRRLQLSVQPAGFRLVGANATGKSTVLEAIAMLATTRSPRTSVERELANWDSGTDMGVPPYARIGGVVARVDGRHRLEIGISQEYAGQGPLKKVIRYDERPRRAVDVVGELKTVLFAPEDVELLSGSPGARRRYLDIAISQASRPYLRSLSRYTRVLEQRNSLLRTFARERVALSSSRQQMDEIAFWDAELTASAADVLAVRLGAVSSLSEKACIHFDRLTDIDSLSLTYVQSRVPETEADLSFERWQSPAAGIRQALSAAFASSLASWHAEELRRGVTAVGPHRDDFVVTVDGIDLGKYGSRGQQRLALIAIKLAELDLLFDVAGETPVLLLDDILSELDERHRSKVMTMLATRRAQICVTATDVSVLSSPQLEHLPLWCSRPGAVEPMG